MADDSEDEDLAALRNAVLASMKSKPKAPPPRTECEDVEDIAALRAAALRTKKATMEPANSPVYPTQTPIMPVESISGVGHNSPYHDPQLPSSPHRQNFHPQQPPGSPHRHPPPPSRPGFVHRQGFPRGRGGFGPRNQSQFAPRNQSQFNVRPPTSNLIVLTTAPEPQQGSGNRKAPPSALSAPSAPSAAVSALMVRPQDKWAGSGAAALEPPKPEKPKGPARFSRFESDSDSDESDMEFGLSSSKDSPSSSSSSSEDEQEDRKDGDGSDHKNGSPKLKESVMEEPTKSPSPPELKEDVKKESPPPQSKSKQLIGEASPKETVSGALPETALTKPDYTRVPPPALSPAPSPKRNPSPPAPHRQPPVTSKLVTKSHPPETSNRDQSRKQLNSQDAHSNNNSASVVISKKSSRPVDTKTGQNRVPSLTKPDNKDQAVLEARRRKFESIPSKQGQDVPKTISLHSGGHKPQDMKPSRKDPPTRERMTKDAKVTDKKVNGRSKYVSPSRSSNSSSENSDSDSSSSNTFSPSDSDSDSDSGRRDKHKAIERGKDDIDRERRQREAREREERRTSRQGKGRETEAIERSHRRPGDQSRLPRSYSKIQNEPERRRPAELPAQYRMQYPDKDRNQSKGSSQDLSRRGKYRREEPKHEQLRREHQQNDRLKEDQKYKSVRREEPRREQSRRDEPKHDKVRREEQHLEKEKRDLSKNDQVKREKINRRDDQKHGRRVIEEPPRERSKREETLKRDGPQQNQQGRLEASNRVSQDLRNKVVSRDSVLSSRKTKRSRTPDTWSDTDQPETELQGTFSGGESDLSELSDIDSPPQKLRSVTRIVKGQANRDHSSTSHSAKDIAQSSRDSRAQRSSERREPSADSSGSHKKTGEAESARFIVDDHKRGKKSVDAREIICKLKGERAESPSSEKTEPVKHNPQISITFNKGTVSEEPALEGKSSKGRLSVHERLGMPVKHKSDMDFDSPELSPELKVTRRVITEDPTDVRHRLKERRKDSESKSDKDTKRGADRRKNNSGEEDKPKKTDKDRKKHKKKDYNIWSSHRAVTVDENAHVDDMSEHAEPTTHLSIEHRLGKVVKDRSASPEAEVQDVRSRLTQKRKKRSIEERLGVQSVIATPPQPIAEQGPERKRAKQQKENTKQSGTEGDLNEKIKRIQEQNEVIRRRKEEVDRDKQRYS